MSPLHIQEFDKTSLLEFTSIAYELARLAVPAYSSKFSKKTYTQHQHIAIICLKVREGDNYKEVVELLMKMPRIREALDLEQVPDQSTLCKALERLKLTVWRIIHLQILDLFDLSGETGIDSSGN